MKTLLAVLLLSASVWASQTTLTGTIRDAQGNGVNGLLTMTLPFPAQDTTTNVAVASTPVFFRLLNGVITGGATLYDTANLQPQGLYYLARAYDQTGNVVFGGAYVVTGATFNLGAATPTSITTSNVSYLTPAFVNGNNTWTGSNTFTQQLLSSVSTGTAPFSIASTTVTPNLNAALLNGNTFLAPGPIGSGTPGTGAFTTETLTGLVTNYNSIATVSNGIPSEYATVDLTGQTASIALTNFYTTTATGLYRVSAYFKVTTPATTSSTLGGMTIQYTDGTDSVVQGPQLDCADAFGVSGGTSTLNTTLALVQCTGVFWMKTGSTVKYADTYASSGATAMAYELHIKLEAM